MQFVAVRDLRSKSAEIWEKLSQEKELVITLNGKPIAVISSVNENNLEQALEVMRRARSMAAVESMQRQSAKSGLDQLPLQKINEEIESVRKERKSKRA